MVAFPIIVSRPHPAAYLPELATRNSGSAVRPSGIESHLDRLSAASVAGNHVAAGVMELAAVEGARSLADENDHLSGFQVLSVYLGNDLTTPRRSPSSVASRMVSASSGVTNAAGTINDSSCVTWDNRILPDRLGSFVSLYV